MRLHLTLAAATITLALAACSSERSGTFEGEDGETGEYTIDTETGEASATIETSEGTATLRSGADVPVSLPDGFSVYPGAKVVSNTVFEQGGQGGALLTMESDDSPEEVAEYYKKQAEAAGVEIQIDASINGGKMIGGEGADGLTFSINASPGDDGTTAQLAIGNTGG